MGVNGIFLVPMWRFGGPTNTSMDYAPFNTNGLWTLSLVLMLWDTDVKEKKYGEIVKPNYSIMYKKKKKTYLWIHFSSGVRLLPLLNMIKEEMFDNIFLF